jgi:hypothetical protein
MHKSRVVRMSTFLLETACLKAAVVSLAFSCVTPAIAGPVSVESTGGLAPPSRLPGAKPGAAVTAAAGGYAIDTATGTLGGGEVRYTAAGATSSLTPLALTFPTPTPPAKTGWGDNTKTKLPNTAEVALSTLVSLGPNPPANTPVMVGRGEWATTANSSTLSAEASVDKRFKGYAAGYANDPYLVAQGTYPILPVLDGGLLLQTNPSDPTSEAAILFSAQSVGLGAANANLWTLGITEVGTLSPVVSFTSAPILGLDDGAVKTMLQSALDISTPGTVLFKPSYQTSGYTLFSTTLSAGNDFQFGDTFEADATNNFASAPPPPTAAAVPEPATATLLGAGTLTLLGYGWRRRKRIA